MIIVRIVKFVSLLVIEVPMFLTRIASAWAAPERCDLTLLIPVTHQPLNRSLPMACSGTTTRERQREKDSETSLRRPNTTGKKNASSNRKVPSNYVRRWLRNIEAIVVTDRDHFARSSTPSEKQNLSRKYDTQGEEKKRKRTNLGWNKTSPNRETSKVRWN